MAAETDYVRVHDGDVVIQGATENTTIADSPATYATLGCPEGDITISNGVSEENVAASNWCTVGTPILNQYRAGNRDVTVSFTLTMDLSDATTKAALDAAEANPPSDFFIKIIVTDNNSTPNSMTTEYRGFFTQFDHSHRQTAVSIFNCSYRVLEILQDNVIAP